MVVLSHPLCAQTPTPPSTRDLRCSASLCAERVIIVMALEAVIAGQTPAGTPPLPGLRIWRTVHRSPFRMDGTLSPAVDVIRPPDINFVRRLWPQSTVVDSVAIVRAADGRLRPGGPLVILAPVEWMGTDTARVRFAMYPERVDYGEEWYVLVRWDESRWRAVSMERGWAN